MLRRSSQTASDAGNLMAGRSRFILEFLKVLALDIRGARRYISAPHLIHLFTDYSSDLLIAAS
jgi:hypothetical protein